MSEKTLTDIEQWRLREVVDAARELPAEQQSQRLQQALDALTVAEYRAAYEPPTGPAPPSTRS